MNERDIAKADELSTMADVLAAIVARSDISDAVRDNATRELADILAQLKQIGAAQ